MTGNKTHKEDQYFILTWHRITPDDINRLDSLPADDARKQETELIDAFNKGVPDMVSQSMTLLEEAGAKPKFVENPFALSIVFKTADAALCEALCRDPKAVVMSTDQAVYENPGERFEQTFGMPTSGRITVYDSAKNIKWGKPGS